MNLNNGILVLFGVTLLLFSNGHLLAAECASIDRYIADREKNFSAVDGECASHDSGWLETYDALVSGDKKELSLSSNDAVKAQQYYEACFHTAAEFSTIDGGEADLVRNAFKEHLGVLLRDGTHGMQEFCSAVLVDGGYIAPLHCFVDEDLKFLTSESERVILLTITSFSRDSLKYDLQDVSGWSAYTTDGGQNYKKVSDTDIVVVVDETGSNNSSLSSQIASFECGEKMFLGGVSQLYGETLDEIYGERSISDVVLFSGYRSWCVSEDVGDGPMRSHYCSTSGGQSGAPVLIRQSDGLFKPVGIHLGSTINLNRDFDNGRAANYMYTLEGLVGKNLQKVRIVP